MGSTADDVRLFLCFAFLFGLTACARAPLVDTTAEAQAIRELDRRWAAADSAKDVEAAVSMYAADAIEMPSNGPAVVGVEAIRRWYATWLPDSNVSITFGSEAIEVAASGDVAFDRGTYRFVTKTQKGQTEDVGKYLTVWRKLGGEWKVGVDMANSDQPCPTP